VSNQQDLKGSLLSQQSLNESRAHFQLSHHLIDKHLLETAPDSDSGSEEEKRLDDSQDSSRSENIQKNAEPENAIEIKLTISKSQAKPRKPIKYLVDIDIETENIFIEVVPTSIVGICNFLNPFEYLYHSSIDLALPNFKQFITNSYRHQPVLSAVKVSKKPSGDVIIGDIKITRIGYISCHMFLMSPEMPYFHNVYQGRVGEYVLQNHFITENEFIRPTGWGEFTASYAQDMAF